MEITTQPTQKELIAKRIKGLPYNEFLRFTESEMARKFDAIIKKYGINQKAIPSGEVIDLTTPSGYSLECTGGDIALIEYNINATNTPTNIKRIKLFNNTIGEFKRAYFTTPSQIRIPNKLTIKFYGKKPTKLRHPFIFSPADLLV